MYRLHDPTSTRVLFHFLAIRSCSREPEPTDALTSRSMCLILRGWRPQISQFQFRHIASLHMVIAISLVVRRADTLADDPLDAIRIPLIIAILRISATPQPAIRHDLREFEAVLGCALTVGSIAVARTRGALEGAQAEDARDHGPAVGDVGDHDGGGRFAGVPVEVDEGAVAGSEVVVAVQDCGEDDEDAEGEHAAEDGFSVERGARVSGCAFSWEVDDGTNLLKGRRALIRRGRGMRSIIRSEEMLKTEAVMRWW